MNILIIGDLHEPFSLDGYLEFCKKIYKLYKCDHVVFIGDIIDSHYSSYHETDPDGYSAGDELRHATNRLAKWHKAFPNADVCIGNHDRMAFRKAFTAGLAKAWIRDLNEVLAVPSWNFQVSFKYDGVKYVHGDKGVTARTKAIKQGQSIVQGHRHTEAYIWHNAGNNTFGMQVGTGIDADSYAMAYSAEQDPALSCGVVLSGKQAHLIPYE